MTSGTVIMRVTVLLKHRGDSPNSETIMISFFCVFCCCQCRISKNVEQIPHLTK